MAGMLKFFFLALVLGVHAVTVQGELICFFKTSFPKYTSDAQEIDVLFSLEAPFGSSPSVSLTSVLDRSGSMKGSKIDLLKKTQQFLVNKLAEANGRNSLGIVTYSNLVRELTSVQPVSSDNKDVLRALIGGISVAGATNIGGGLERGLIQQNDASGGKLKSVYLFTDGIPTDGPTTTEEILNVVRGIQSQSSEKITISTFGFGSDLDVGLLQAIAEVGGGESYIITNENDIPAAFGDALGGLLSTAAEDIVVSFKPLNGAEIDTIQTGGDVSSDNGVVRVKFSNLFAEEERDIVIKLKLPEGSGNQGVLEASVDYVDGSTLQKVFKNPEPLVLDRTSDKPSEETPEKDVEAAGLKFTTAKALAEATAKATQGDTQGAATAIATAIATVEVSPVKDDPTIQALLKDIQTIKQLLEEQQKERAAEKAKELEGTLTSQRSVSSDSDLESAKIVDTTVKRETRDESEDQVLSPPVSSIGGTEDTAAAGPTTELASQTDPSPAPTPESSSVDEPSPAPTPESSSVNETSPASAPEVTSAQSPSPPASETATTPAPVSAANSTPTDQIKGPAAEAPTGDSLNE